MLFALKREVICDDYNGVDNTIQLCGEGLRTFFPKLPTTPGFEARIGISSDAAEDARGAYRVQIRQNRQGTTCVVVPGHAMIQVLDGFASKVRLAERMAVDGYARVWMEWEVQS